MARKVRIAAVSYLNTLPMVYGMQHHSIASEVVLTLAVPALCAQLLQEKKVDLALLPVGALVSCRDVFLLPDYCIGANDSVESVCILSHVPLHNIQRLYLDPDSRTSVLLARILLSQYWDLQLQSLPLVPHLLDLGSTLNDAVLLIGDKVFEYRSHYAYSYDLAHTWHVWTQLPMVFAVWASTSPLEASFTALFNEAMEFGFSHIPEALNNYPLPSFITKTNASDYLTRRIDYHFDTAKHQALELYLQKVNRLPDLAPQLV